ncbi:hypothetical protein [Gorillibacterium timonense]|uniref:hypothetical protein n=1 Tax=Gorillibacterium timonense TaxID=1689269 RepID=UPI00071D3D98|nr:hypothetical protein [Gorillibacterium timonense]
MRITIWNHQIERLAESSALLTGTNLPGQHTSKQEIREGFGEVSGNRNLISESRFGACADLTEEARKNG